MQLLPSKGFGCLSLFIGGALAFTAQAILVVAYIQFMPARIILAPGWAYFDPGRDDGTQMFSATILDTLYYTLAFYLISYLAVRFLRREQT